MNKALIGIDNSGSYRVYLAVTTALAEEARVIHNTTPLATAALGRALTGAGMMGLMLKNEKDRLTVQFKGDGPAREILAVADGAGRVKGYISNPDVDVPKRSDGKLDVGGALGIGMLTVIKDLGMKEPYVGRIDLVSGEIAEDLTAYFFVSEQQSSSVALGVRIDTDYSVAASGGLIIQMLPGGKPEAVDALETMIAHMKPISTLVEDAQEKVVGQAKGQSVAKAVGNVAEEQSAEAMLCGILKTIFQDMPEEFQVEPLEYRDLFWSCDCSTERMERALISIGEKDLREIYEEDGQAELVCQFCLSPYQFDRERLERLLAEIK